MSFSGRKLSARNAPKDIHQTGNNTSTKPLLHNNSRVSYYAPYGHLSTSCCVKFFAHERKQHLQPCLHHSVGLTAEAPRAADRLHHLAPEVAAQQEVAHLANPGDVELVEEPPHPPAPPKLKGYYKDCKVAL